MELPTSTRPSPISTTGGLDSQTRVGQGFWFKCSQQRKSCVKQFYSLSNRSLKNWKSDKFISTPKLFFPLKSQCHKIFSTSFYGAIKLYLYLQQGNRPGLGIHSLIYFFENENAKDQFTLLKKQMAVFALLDKSATRVNHSFNFF